MMVVTPSTLRRYASTSDTEEGIQALENDEVNGIKLTFSRRQQFMHILSYSTANLLSFLSAYEFAMAGYWKVCWLVILGIVSSWNYTAILSLCDKDIKTSLLSITGFFPYVRFYQDRKSTIQSKQLQEFFLSTIPLGLIPLAILFISLLVFQMSSSLVEYPYETYYTTPFNNKVFSLQRRFSRISITSEESRNSQNGSVHDRTANLFRIETSDLFPMRLCSLCAVSAVSCFFAVALGVRSQMTYDLVILQPATVIQRYMTSWKSNLYYKGVAVFHFVDIALRCLTLALLPAFPAILPFNIFCIFLTQICVLVICLTFNGYFFDNLLNSFGTILVSALPLVVAHENRVNRDSRQSSLCTFLLMVRGAEFLSLLSSSIFMNYIRRDFLEDDASSAPSTVKKNYGLEYRISVGNLIGLGLLLIYCTVTMLLVKYKHVHENITSQSHEPERLIYSTQNTEETR